MRYALIGFFLRRGCYSRMCNDTVSGGVKANPITLLDLRPSRSPLTECVDSVFADKILNTVNRRFGFVVLYPGTFLHAMVAAKLLRDDRTRLGR